MQNTFFIDKSCGTILGTAIGDALGAPVEGLKPAHIKNLFKTLDRYVDLNEYANKGIRSYRLKGLYTDDTQQMLSVCDAILENNGLSPQTVSNKLIAMCQDDISGGFGVFRGTGHFFRSTMQDYLRGTPWDKIPGASAGCMAAVRIPPVPVYYFDDPIKILIKTIEASLVTHKDPIGISAALWQANLIFQLLSLSPGDDLDITSLFDQCAQFCRQGELMLASQFGQMLSLSHPDGLHAVSEFIPGFGKILLTHNDTKINQFISDYALHFASMPISKLTVPYALTLVPLAMKLFFMNKTSFKEPVIHALNSGGDTDTLAALTCALSGAYWGLSHIPESWLQGLVNMNQLKTRAEALVKGKKGLVLHNLVDMEKKLTQREAEFVQKCESIHPKPAKKKPQTKKESFRDPSAVLVPPKEKKGDRRKFEKKKAIDKKIRRQGKIIY